MKGNYNLGKSAIMTVYKALLLVKTADLAPKKKYKDKTCVEHASKNTNSTKQFSRSFFMYYRKII